MSEGMAMRPAAWTPTEEGYYWAKPRVAEGAWTVVRVTICDCSACKNRPRVYMTGNETGFPAFAFEWRVGKIQVRDDA